MGDGKSLLAGTMIKNLEHKCDFEGCDAILAHDHLLGHFKICEYREVVCPCSGEVVAFKNLQSHLLNSPCAPVEVCFDCASDSNTQMIGTRKIVCTNYFTVSGM